MASFKAFGRNNGPKRGKGQRNQRRFSRPNLELLESRRLLSGPPVQSSPVPVWTPTDTNLFDAQNGPMANLGVGLVDIYKAFVESGGNTSSVAAQFPDIEFQNGMVGLQLKTNSPDFTDFVAQLSDLGMHVVTSSSHYGMVDGYAPISSLPSIAQMPLTQSGTVQYSPLAYQEYQGIAYNEAETSLFADVARTEFNVDGTGVTMGVLSTSVNQYNGGLSASYGTGDLNPNEPVDVIQDDPNAPTDEGRAMLENIHDIAPGAKLQFATAFINEMSFGDNIEALAKAGSQIIVDDVGYADEPMFQSGFVSQAVDTVTAAGVSYFSAAGNEGPDSGYLSTFRPASGNITGIGSGTFMNFNPSGTPNLMLPITTGINNALITFQYDQPYEFQEPAGSPGVVTSNVNIYVLNSAGTVVVGAAANQNNVAVQQPWQFIEVPTAGQYYVVVQVVSGANPGHIEFAGFNDTNGAVTVSTQYGTAGGTSYPSSFGHASDANTIGVGATPWWAPTPYLGQNPLASEPFSSSGPTLTVYTDAGVPLTTPLNVQNPVITAPDGGNTSFFEAGFFLNTTQPPFPGEPATSTDLVPANQQALPVFFGTSSAAPNAAAVAALMLQKVPGLTPAEIRQGLIDSATPMNGAPAGYDVWAGYGLINAISAINAVDLLRVVSTNPANGSTVTVTPSAITVTFNKPVNFSTILNAASPVLTFTGEPAGVTVNVGTPIAVDNPTDPTIVQWPFSFTKKAGTLANGSYTFSVQSPATGAPVQSVDGKDLVASGPIKFTLADVTAPVVTKTTINGRQVQITFSKALDPSTVTLANIMVLRKDGGTTWPPTAADLTTAGYVDLNNDPRTTISYNPTTFTVTLNYSGLPQTELPSDNYAIVVVSPTTAGAAGVTDIVGNPLDGDFTGTFPSGQDHVAGDFIQNLGLQAVAAPVITTFELTPTAANDTGIVGDQNTMVTEPNFVGQVYSSFPGTVANLSVYIQFGGYHDGVITLGVGTGGSGFSGSYDLMVITDANGGFTFTAPNPLPEGFQIVQAVVVGQNAKLTPLPGLSSAKADGFRIDLTPPQITGASFTPGGPSLPLPNGPAPTTTQVPGLTALSLYAVDPVNPTVAPFGTPAQVVFDALNPATADNISNYSLVNLSQNDQDESQYIATATFVPTNTILDPSGTYVIAFTGRIDVTFSSGLPAGEYEFIAHTTELQYPGITDAAGNPLNDITVPGEGTKDFVINFDVQPVPVYITSEAFESTYSSNGSTVIGGPQSYYELPPAGGTNTRDNVPAPPTAVVINFSNPLPLDNSAGQPINYTQDVQLIASANSPGSAPDGEFGNLGEGGLASTGNGFTVLSNYTVTLYNYNSVTQTSVPVQPGGSGNRLVLQLNPGATLAADNYRVYLPNQVEPGDIDTRIDDIYGNQLDGENLGNPTSQPSPDFPNSPIFLAQYQDLLSSGVNRAPDMSGDGVPGGAFMSAFTVVNYGNVVFARPDYVENPLLPSTLSNGSLANPYPVLAPEGDPNTAPANPNHNPNGGLNSTFFYQPGNFNVAYDRSGDGLFEQSALYAASQLSFAVPGTSQLGGPVVVVALPGIPQRNPVTGVVTQATFSLQAPAGPSATINNGSTSVPFDTLLTFAAGSTLKLQNASLYVQNQGAAFQTQGTSTNPVTFTSYNDASIGGPTNNNPDTTPHAGDWGGIVFRSYDDAILANQVSFPVDGVLVGANGAPAVSGADDAMSIINFATIRYGGGAVPQGSSNFYSAITAYNSRPMITNDLITDTGGTGGTEAAIGVDMDSLREDDTARGILVRQVTVQDNSLNAIWLMAEANGFIEPTNAVPLPTNPSTLGGEQNYTLFAPLPYVVLAQLIVGQELQVNTGGLTQWVQDRLYVQPGVMMKFGVGSGLDLLNPGSSLNIGSRSYINGYDQNNDYSPLSPGFVEESASDPTVLFTSIHDDLATTKLVPSPINVTGETTTPTLGASMWGSVGIQSGGIAVINAATFQYGGGSVNTQDFTIPSQSVLAFISDFTTFNLPPTAFDTLGSHVYITNNNFDDNFDAAMQIEPNGLLAGDPLRPLLSGHPFFRGNVMQGNGIDGLVVTPNRVYLYTNDYGTYLGPEEDEDGIATQAGYANQTVNTVWDATDLTYVLKGTIILGPSAFDEFEPGVLPAPDPTAYGPIAAPTVSLTIQAALPGTLLADGETIPAPGQSVIVKMYSDEAPFDAGAANLATSYGSSGAHSSLEGGAGFLLGVEDGVDPTASPLLDQGLGSALRILGIPGNQTTGQQRVPVIITSLRDGSVGTTVRGVKMYNIWNSAPVEEFLAQQAGKTLVLDQPAAGDGGYIYVGGLSQTEYDPTNPLGGGSYIDNADISYMTRIEIQGGGVIDTGGTATADYYQVKNGYAGPITQFNSPMTFTIADSNLNEFADAAVFAHSEALDALDGTYTTIDNETFLGVARGSLVGEPVYLYMYNDTIANSGQGVHVNANPTDTSTTENSNFVAVLVNNTFYNDPFAIQTISPQFDGKNIQANVNVLAMNNIFDGSSSVAVNIQGMAAESQLQYNLFFNNAANAVITTTFGDFAGNVNAIYANPDFVDAATGNFDLEPTSPAIDEARSEIGPLVGGNAIYPTTTISLNGGVLTESRTDPTTLTGSETPGRSLDFAGAYTDVEDSRQIVTLPGSGFFNFPDEYVPVLDTNPNGYSTSSQVTGTYNYQPISGQRDILGFIRTPQQGSGPGYGSSPFMDIGAYQYVNLHPPEVTGVTETPTNGGTPVNFYNVGTSPAGANTTPWTIDISFNGPIDPNSINASTVLLTDLGSNPAAPIDEPINLSGKLSYISNPETSTYTLVISLAAAGLTLPTDAYQIELLGSGSPVLASPQGIALDGQNTVGGLSTGAQLALPSGTGYPGSNFFDSFIINTTPSQVQPGSLKLDPASDTNIVGDNITYSTLPTFDGTVEEPNATLVPVAGQTVILNVGISLHVNGVETTYYNPANLPASLSSYAQYIRQDAGTATSGTGGVFQVTVGIDGANTGLVTSTKPLPGLFPIYNVGASGDLSPVPGTDSGYYVAQVVVIDQSGNQSNPNDPNANLPFIVDTTPPTATFTSPTQGEVITSLVNGQLNFAFTTNKNLSTLTAASLQLISAGPDGILGDADDVTIPINASSIHVTLLDAGTGGKGAELVTFSSEGTLTNNLYEVNLVTTGSSAFRDIAGNTPTSSVGVQFAVDVPALQQNIFVNAANTNPTPTGTLANPYPTIGKAMSVAVPGDVIAVLPGVYTEQVTLKPLVKLYSVNPATATQNSVFTTSTGFALDTVIRAPFVATAPAGLYPTVSATGVQSFGALSTEIAGFTISSPLVTDPAVGQINPNSVGIELTNSNVVVDKDYIVDAGNGILVTTSGAGAMFPQIDNDGIIGNTYGVVITDAGTTSVATAPTSVINNDFAFNTVGLLLNNSATSPEQAYVASNIFWENHDQTNDRFGYAIYSLTPNKVSLQNNMFFGNGASDTTQYTATNNLGNGFSPGLLGTTAAAAQSDLGNFVGAPAFVFPIDPRPGSDGPAAFFIDSNYQITSASAAIDNAWEPTAIPTDFLGNSRTYEIAGKGFGLPNYGPRDVGAFEYLGTGGIVPVGGSAFRVVTDSLVPVGGASAANGGTLTLTKAPTSITVTFSDDVNQASISATDLILSGSAADVHATSLSWVDGYTVTFNLSGPLTSGTLNLAIPAGSIQSVTGTANQGYSDDVVIKIPAATTIPVSPKPPTPVAPTPPSHKKKPAPKPKPKPKHVVVHKAATHKVVVDKPKPKGPAHKG